MSGLLTNRKHSAEVSHRGQDPGQLLEQQHQYNQTPNRAEVHTLFEHCVELSQADIIHILSLTSPCMQIPVIRNDRITEDDLVSVGNPGNPAPSIETERTDCHPLMHKYLKDCEDYPAPDGEVDNGFPTEKAESSSSENSSPDIRLLGTSGNRRKVIELNSPSKLGKIRVSENVELDLLPTPFGLAYVEDEQSSKENVPLLSSGKGVSQNLLSAKSDGWRRLHSLGKKDRPPLLGRLCQPSSARNPPLGKLPSPQESSVPRFSWGVTGGGGYVSEATATSRPPVPTTLVPIPSPPKLSSSTPLPLAVNTSTPKQDKPSMPGYSQLSVLQGSTSKPHSASQATAWTPSTVQPATGMNASGYIQESATQQPLEDFIAGISDAHATPLRQHEAIPRHQGLGYLQEEQSTKEENLFAEVNAIELEDLSEPESDASSQNSVFEDTTAVGHHTLTPPPPFTPCRNRSAMTSGVFSQSEQVTTSGPLDQEESGFCDSTDNSGTKMSTNTNGRIGSEGYVSEPPTPGQKQIDFTFQQPPNIHQPTISTHYTPSPPVINGSSTEMCDDQVHSRSYRGRQSSYVPTSLNSLENCSQAAGPHFQGDKVPRLSLSSGPSMVTWLYSGVNSSSEEFRSDNANEHSLTGYVVSSGPDRLPLPTVTARDVGTPQQGTNSVPSLSPGNHICEYISSPPMIFASGDPGTAAEQSNSHAQATESLQTHSTFTMATEKSSHSLTGKASETGESFPPTGLPDIHTPSQTSSRDPPVLATTYTLPSLLVSAHHPPSHPTSTIQGCSSPGRAHNGETKELAHHGELECPGSAPPIPAPTVAGPVAPAAGYV